MQEINVLNVGEIKLDLNSRRLFYKKNKIALRNKEFTLMEYMMSNIGKVVSRTQILEDVWDRNIFCNTNTIDVHISKLRKKIKKYTNYSLIQTVHSVGYMIE